MAVLPENTGKGRSRKLFFPYYGLFQTVSVNYIHFPTYKKRQQDMLSFKRETGFEPATPTLARLYSTPEPLAQIVYQLQCVFLHLTQHNIQQFLCFVNRFFKFLEFFRITEFYDVYAFKIALKTYWLFGKFF